ASVGGSSSGRTSVSGSDYLGSIPSPPANNFSTPYSQIDVSVPYRAGGSSSGRTPAFGAGYLGSIPSPPATFLCPLRYLSQRRQIDHESKAYVALEDSLVGFVHVLNRNHFNIGLNPVRGAEVEHLLGFSDATDHRPGDAAAMQNQWKGFQRHWLIRSTHENQGAVGFEQTHIGVIVVRS